MSDELKGLAMGTIMWAVIGGNYAITAIAFKILYEAQREADKEFQAARTQVNLAIGNAVSERDRRFTEIEKDTRQATEQHTEQLSAILRDMQVRLSELAQQQAEMRADLRNLKDLKEDIRTLLSKRR